jgi:hypothetical protein
MSIIDKIKLHCKNGGLFPVEPWFPGDALERGMFISAEIHQMLELHADDSSSWGKMAARMDTFVSGRRLSVGAKPANMMCRLRPEKKLGCLDNKGGKPKARYSGVRAICRKGFIYWFNME